MTDTNLFLDSSIWLGYFLENIPKTKEIIDSEENTLFTSIISIHEITKRLEKLKKTQKEINEALKFIEENSIIIGIDKKTALTAVENCRKYKLHTVDSLIYSSAAEINTTFITADTDFKKCPKTRIIEIKSKKEKNK
ncbi:MAG: PIN domain-containing protein [Candidatus Diapherotrites archaeon]